MTDNELIAEFMKLDKHPNNQRAYWIEETGSYLTFDNLEFHKSWNQLIPVVEKIESFGYAVDVYKNCCEISTEDMIRWEGEDKHEACYKAVVEFIKWYKLENP